MTLDDLERPYRTLVYKWYVFLQISAMSSERRIYNVQCNTAVQGHSRSLTIGLSCRFWIRQVISLENTLYIAQFW